MVGKDLGAYGHGERQTEEKAECEEPEAQGTEAAGEDVEQGPGETVGKNESRIAAGTSVADSASPTELVVDEAAPAIGRDGSFDDFSAEDDTIAGSGNAGAKFVVIGEMVNKGRETTDFV